MIKPHKHLDLDSSVLNLSAIILLKLKTVQVIKYNELFNYTINYQDSDISFNFLNALNLLYLFGLIKYESEIDSIELIQ
jgi:ABC-3C biological conflict system middle component